MSLPLPLPVQFSVGLSTACAMPCVPEVRDSNIQVMVSGLGSSLYIVPLVFSSLALEHRTSGLLDNIFIGQFKNRCRAVALNNSHTVSEYAGGSQQNSR
jgi:hypothetical protein